MLHVPKPLKTDVVAVEAEPIPVRDPEQEFLSSSPVQAKPPQGRTPHCIKPDPQIGRCRWCGKDVVQVERGRRRLYCRDRCRKDAHDARKISARIEAEVRRLSES